VSHFVYHRFIMLSDLASKLCNFKKKTVTALLH
jgi:hypothetical protein